MALENDRPTAVGGKRAGIALLLVVNFALLLALLTFHNSLPTAAAQAGARGSEYICVTAKPSGQAYDVLFVLDPASHKLHGFYPSPPPGTKMLKSEPRDVRKDFGN